MMNFGTMMSMIAGQRITSSARTISNMMKTDYGLKTRELMILIVKKIEMLMTSIIVKKMTVWAMKRVKILMMNSKRKMMIDLPLDLPDLLQKYLPHQDLPETFLAGCLPVETLLDTLRDI